MNALLEWTAGIDMRIALLVYLVILDAWVLSIVFRTDASGREKALWTGIVVLCPVVGCVLFYVLGPKPPLPEGGEA